MADLLKLDPDKKEQQAVLDQVLKTLKENGAEDEDWDEKDLVQQAYKACNLKRYKLDLQLMQVRTKVDAQHEVVESVHSLKDGSSATDAITDSTVVIKIEEPEILELGQKKVVVKSGEVRLSGLLQEVRRLKAQVDTLAATTEGWNCNFNVSLACNVLFFC